MHSLVSKNCLLALGVPGSAGEGEGGGEVVRQVFHQSVHHELSQADLQVAGQVLHQQGGQN